MAIDEKKLIEDLEKYHNGLKPSYITKLVESIFLDIRDIVNEQPKVGDWIPCSERLPENCGRYLVCSEDVIWVADFFNNVWWGIERRCRWGDVQAWMTLPEPYKEEVTE